MGINGVSDDWMAKEGVISYLWDQWKTTLQDEVTWNEFQSAGSRATGLVERWVENEAEWESVLERYATVLNEDLQG